MTGCVQVLFRDGGDTGMTSPTELHDIQPELEGVLRNCAGVSLLYFITLRASVVTEELAVKTTCDFGMDFFQ